MIEISKNLMPMCEECRYADLKIEYGRLKMDSDDKVVLRECKVTCKHLNACHHAVIKAAFGK